MDETPTIIVPSHLRKLYESAMQYADDSRAIFKAIEITEDLDGIEKETIDVQRNHAEKLEFASNKIISALDLRCPACDDRHAKKWGVGVRAIPACIIDLKRGSCMACGTPIVLEWKVV